MTPALVLSKNIFYRNRESEHIFNLEDCVRIIISWSKWRDSNSRHPAPKAGALPTALHLDTYTLLDWTNKNLRRASCCGARHPLRLTKQARVLPTAATRSAPFIRHRRRSPRSPTALHLDTQVIIHDAL